MEQLQERLIYCSGPRVANTPLFRRDPQGRGVWLWCRGHHREELKTWEALGMTRAIAASLLVTMKEP